MKKYKKLIIGLVIFALGFLLGILSAPYLQQNYLGAYTWPPELPQHPNAYSCVKYTSPDSEIGSTHIHTYECFQDFRGDPVGERWDCYNDGGPDGADGSGYAYAYPSGGCVNPTNPQY